MPKHRSKTAHWSGVSENRAEAIFPKGDFIGNPKRLRFTADNLTRFSKNLLHHVGYRTIPHWREGARHNWIGG